MACNDHPTLCLSFSLFLSIVNGQDYKKIGLYIFVNFVHSIANWYRCTSKAAKVYVSTLLSFETFRLIQFRSNFAQHQLIYSRFFFQSLFSRFHSGSNTKHTPSLPLIRKICTKICKISLPLCLSLSLSFCVCV